MVKDENGKSGFLITPRMLVTVATLITILGVVIGATISYASIQKDVQYIIQDRAKNGERFAPISAIERVDIQYKEVIRRLECIEVKVDKQAEREARGRK